MSGDPWAGDPQSPLSLHAYLYANANPITYYDPTGKFTLVECLTSMSISATIGAITAVATSYMSGYRDWALFKARLIGFGTGAAGGILFGSLKVTIALGAVSAMSGSAATQMLVQGKNWSNIDISSLVWSGLFGAISAKFSDIIPRSKLEDAIDIGLRTVIAGLCDLELEWLYVGAQTVPNYWERLLSIPYSD